MLERIAFIDYGQKIIGVERSESHYILRVWDTASARVIDSFPIEIDGISHFSVIGNDSICIGDFSGILRCWQYSVNMKLTEEIDLSDNFEEITSVDVSSDGHLWCIGADNCIILRNSSDKSVIHKICQDSAPVISVFCSDDVHIVVGKPCEIIKQAIKSRQVVTSIKTRCEPFVRICRRMLNNSEIFVMWDTFDLSVVDFSNTSNPLHSVPQPNGSKNTPFTPGDVTIDGNIIVTGYSRGDIYTVDTKSQSLLMKFEGHSQTIIDVIFSPDGKSILSTSYDGTTRLWDVQRGRERLRYT